MKIIFKHFIPYISVFFTACLLSYFFCSCNNDSELGNIEELTNSSKELDKQNDDKKASSITFASWNVQTFFDAQTEGTEYDDFKKPGNWSRDKYTVRLQRLCEVMTSLNPDVFVLEEIENQAVLQDISNFLEGKNWKNHKKWTYACFSKESGASIGCAVFSRHRIFDITCHSMDIRCQQTVQPSCRPIIEFSLEADGKQLTVLVNHWKSKLGTDESKIWRQWQENLAASRACRILPSPLILCGDFNQDAKEFCCDFSRPSEGNVIFRGIEKKTLRVNCPWFTQNGSFSTTSGSYYYQGDWERIDHIFSAGSARLAAFSPKAEEPWADSEGRPVSYKLYNGEGYSDHLPVMCIVNF